MDEEKKRVPKPRYITEYRKMDDIFKKRPYNPNNSLDKLIVRCFVCLMVVAVVLLTKNMDNFIGKAVIGGVQWSLGWRIEGKSIATFLEGIKNVEEEVKQPENALTEDDIIAADLEGFVNPINQGVVVSNFGERVHPVYNTVKLHTGIDIDAEYGVEIKASTSGIVEYVGEDDTSGKYIRIKNGEYQTSYAHCSKIIAQQGQVVKQGDIIAEVGDTGLTTGPHVHFEIWYNGEPMDPLNKIAKYENQV